MPSTREETHAAEQRRNLAEKRIEETDAGGVALKAWRGGVTQTCRSELLCDTAGVGVLSVHFPTGSPFGHHPRLSIGCPRWGQWVRTRDTQLNSIPAYRLCSCGYSRSLLRRSPLLYGMYAFADTLTHCTSSASASTQSRLRRRRTMRNRG